ncbi:hypothetical protein MHYP_G00337960 [Metynnis hypsauchen]
MNSHCVCHSEVFRPAAGEFKGEGSVGVMMRRRKSPTNDAVFHVAAGRDRAGLDVQHISAFKGRGVFAVTGLARGEFVLEFRGDLISAEESRRRRRVYHGAVSAFMLDFLWHGKFWTIDAARDDGSLGRLVNDDHINPNCKMKRLIVEGRPHLCLFALRDITPGEELTYDYGDADRPWRSEVTKSGMEADNNHLESEGASGDDQHRTKPSQHKSAFGVQMTKNGMEAGSNRLVSDGASADDHHRTQHSQHESTFCNEMAKNGMEAGSNRLVSDGASADDRHRTQHSQHESTFCNEMAKNGMEAGSNRLVSDDPGAEPFEPSTQQAQETLAEQAIEPTSTTSVPKGVKMVKRKKWQTSEVKAVEKHLNRLI